MKRKVLAGIIAVAILSLLGVTIGASHKSSPKPFLAEEPTRSQLLALVNAERAKHGVAPLKEDPRLDASAQMKAQDEVTYNYFGHISPSSSPNAGKNSHDYIASTGIVCVDTSENLVEYGTIGNSSEQSAEAAVGDWIDSPPHHQAMIDPNYSLTGFGIDSKQIVEHFCQTN